MDFLKKCDEKQVFILERPDQNNISCVLSGVVTSQELTGIQGLHYDRLRLIHGNLTCRHSSCLLPGRAGWLLLGQPIFSFIYKVQSLSFQSLWLAHSLHAPPRHVHGKQYIYFSLRYLSSDLSLVRIPRCFTNILDKHPWSSMQQKYKLKNSGGFF